MIEEQPVPAKPEWVKTNITPFAMTNFRGRREVFGIKMDDRRRHVYIIGKTGMGKSTMLENMIMNDIIADKGLAVVDPHGDTVEKIIKYIPSNRINDVIYFDPSDLDHPVGFNVLERVETEYTHLVASGLIGVFKKIWADSWGPRLEYILANAILALLASEGNTMLGITRMLVDKGYRKKVVSKVSDPMVRSFWVDEFENYNDRFRSEAIAPIQNKVGQFLSSSIIRNIVGQTKSTINLNDIMNNRKILLLNLSKGRVGEENSALLGAMMITKIQLSAMERVRIPEQERVDFALYVDEFQNFATEAFATILSEARKYRLSLIMGHQYIKQVPEPVQDAVFGNVGTMIVFRIGAEDAERFELEFSEAFSSNDFVNLERGHIYIKLMIDGIASRPFSAISLPPLKEELMQGNEEKIVRVSRERYAKERATIEEKIARWAMTGVHKDAEGTREGKGEGKQKTVYVSKCDACGGTVETFFKPDPKKPIYCDDCFAKIKAERELKMQQGAGTPTVPRPETRPAPADVRTAPGIRERQSVQPPVTSTVPVPTTRSETTVAKTVQPPRRSWNEDRRPPLRSEQEQTRRLQTSETRVRDDRKGQASAPSRLPRTSKPTMPRTSMKDALSQAMKSSDRAAREPEDARQRPNGARASTTNNARPQLAKPRTSVPDQGISTTNAGQGQRHEQRPSRRKNVSETSNTALPLEEGTTINFERR